MTTKVAPKAPPKTLPENVDIAIIGTGLTGLCLALFLAQKQPSWQILIIESDDSGSTSKADRLETGFSQRQIALAESSRRLFLDAGMWPAVEAQAAAITAIHVSDRGHPGHSQLIAREQGLDTFGHVIDAGVLAGLLDNSLDNLANVQRCPGPGGAASSIVLKPRAEGMVVQLGDSSIPAHLVLLANGTKPVQAQSLGIQFKYKEYGYDALTAELTLKDSHRGIAYERFTREGPIALLPLPDRDGFVRAALVWTMAHERGERLLAAHENSFIDELQNRFGDRAGEITGVAHRHLTPLSRTLAGEQVRSHLALMGTAAHSLHPVAGQGFNLTLRDIAGLCEVLARADARGKKPGELAILQLYEKNRLADQRQVVAFSDALPQLFASTNPLLSLARNLGLLGIEVAPGLGAAVARFGAGLTSRELQVSD